ncbi:hypothetical protein GCM10020295_27630 [Streptomyces cinereospinus]
MTAEDAEAQPKRTRTRKTAATAPKAVTAEDTAAQPKRTRTRKATAPRPGGDRRDPGAGHAGTGAEAEDPPHPQGHGRRGGSGQLIERHPTARPRVGPGRRRLPQDGGRQR